MNQQIAPPPIFDSAMEVERYLVNNLYNRHHANYYPAMANLAIDEALARRNLSGYTAIDVGCGIGISTMEILERTGAARVLAVDSSEAMLRICKTGFLGEPRVRVTLGRAEELANIVGCTAQAIFCIQMIHLLHKSEAESKVPNAIHAFSRVLASDGVLAMDFGPSNGDFRSFKLADPRVGPQSEGEVMTELAHPLYRRVMEQLPVTARTYGAAIESFWPPAATRFTRQFLEETLAVNGFRDIRFVEGLYPMRGVDVWNHIYLNLWTVAKRWLATSGLTTDLFFGMLEEAIRTVRSADGFNELVSIPAFHPYQVLTAVRK